MAFLGLSLGLPFCRNISPASLPSVSVSERSSAAGCLMKRAQQGASSGSGSRAGAGGGESGYRFTRSRKTIRKPELETQMPGPTQGRGRALRAPAAGRALSASCSACLKPVGKAAGGAVKLRAAGDRGGASLWASLAYGPSGRGPRPLGCLRPRAPRWSGRGRRPTLPAGAHGVSSGPPASRGAAAAAPPFPPTPGQGRGACGPPRETDAGRRVPLRAFSESLISPWSELLALIQEPPGLPAPTPEINAAPVQRAGEGRGPSARGERKYRANDPVL